ncbi:MAG TPA: ribonuclease III [Candidatus Acidoferrales bacterium]
MVLPRLDEIEEILQHRFRDSSLLERALTHSSAVADGPGEPPSADSERLEFLGDAVLGMLVSDYLLASFPDWSEGQLSRGRAHLVNAASLSAAAQRLGLGGHLLLGRGEEKTGGRRKPALLADAFEAVVGAIYLDAGIDPAREFVARALRTAIEAEGDRLGRADYKSELQELLQKCGWPAARYRVLRETGPDHQKKFLVEVSVAGRVAATGAGSNKKESEQSAAQQALEQLRGVQAGQ